MVGRLKLFPSRKRRLQLCVTLKSQIIRDSFITLSLYASRLEANIMQSVSQDRQCNHQVNQAGYTGFFVFRLWGVRYAANLEFVENYQRPLD
jgi:hypothetical protein